MGCGLCVHKALKNKEKKEDWVRRDSDCRATQKVLAGSGGSL